MVCVGYVGAEAFDIVLYIGHTLARLKYPVLIVDLSGSGALKNAIHHGMDIDSSMEIVHYRNLNYIRRMPDINELEEFADGAVFMVFGFHYADTGPVRLDCMNIVVNPFPHILDKVNALLKDSIPDNMKLRLLVRDIISPDDLEIIKSNIMPAKNLDCINCLYLDFNDYENAIRCQRTQTVRFRKVSYRMKKYIAREAKYITSGLIQSKYYKLKAPSVFIAGEGEVLR